MSRAQARSSSRGIDKIAFTGSTAIGRQAASVAGRALKQWL
jgi:acyl-CoA reductase-like NAD-dependent aldehyde dehydrogenase